MHCTPDFPAWGVLNLKLMLGGSGSSNTYLTWQCTVAEPPKPPVLTIDGNKICFRAESLPVFPVQRYEVAVYDVTGERAAFRNISAKNNCTLLDSNMFKEAKCAPFEVSARAFNDNGPSNATVKTIGDNKGLKITGIMYDKHSH